MVSLMLSIALAFPPSEIAPAPRPKATHDCLCVEGDFRCRARAALALQHAAKTIPTAMPSAERLAARAALEKADKTIKATKVPPTER